MRLNAARTERTAWLDEHADVVDRYDLIRRAERHRRLEVAANPEQYLPVDVAEQAGPEPVLQRERRAWSAALVDKALATTLDAASRTRRLAHPDA